MESSNVAFVETPSKLVSPPIKTPDNNDETDNIGIISFHDGLEGRNMLRDVRDYTSRIDFNNDVVYDHTNSIVQPRDPATAEILTKIRGLIQEDVLAGEETPGEPADGVDRQQSPTDDGGGLQPAVGGENGEQGGPAGGMTSNSGGVPPQHPLTPAVTRSSRKGTSALLSTAALRKLQQLCLYTITNVKLQGSEGEKVLLTPNTLRETMALPQAARWTAASDKERESASTQALRSRAQYVHTNRAGSDQLDLGLQDQGGQLI